MAKIVVNNLAGEPWVDVINTKVNLFLASTLSSLSVVHVSLEKLNGKTIHDNKYRCEVQGVYSSSKRLLASNENPNALAAIEGAVHRLKRSIVRQRQFGDSTSYRKQEKTQAP